MTLRMVVRIEIYTTRLCAACVIAKELLTRHGIEFRDVDVSDNPELRRDMANRASGDRSVPQIFADGHHVGDLEKLEELISAGQLASVFAAIAR